MPSFRDKEMYKELINVMSANLSFVEDRATDKNLAERDWYVIAVPNTYTALSLDRNNALVVTDIAARAVYAPYDEAEQLRQQYKSFFHTSFQLISELDYLTVVYNRAYRFMSEFSEIIEDEEE